MNDYFDLWKLVAGLGLFGLSIGYLVFVEWLEVDKAFEIVTAYGLGASTIALFSRVGGGIYTKAADVGADLVGKVEAGIPEDDPRNPATIADNVGDNVGDVAGMGADLFESYVGSIISALTLVAVGVAFFANAGTDLDGSWDAALAVLPLVVRAPRVSLNKGLEAEVEALEAGTRVRFEEYAPYLKKTLPYSAFKHCLFKLFNTYE